jgi:protein SCO1
LLTVSLLTVAAGCGSSSTSSSAASHPGLEGLILRPAKPAPALALRNYTGQSVSLSHLRGKAVLVTFVYTHCPDVCPLIAQNLDRAVKSLGTDAKQVTILAVSVDPKGDTRPVVRTYVAERGLGPRFHYLLGTHSQLQPVWQAYNLLIVGRSLGVVDHSTYTLLIDRNGKPRLYYEPTAKMATILGDLRKFVSR